MVRGIIREDNELEIALGLREFQMRNDFGAVSDVAALILGKVTHMDILATLKLP